MAGTSGTAGQRCGEVTPSRAHGAGARLFERRRQIVENHCTLFEMMPERDRRAAIGDVDHVDLGHRLNNSVDMVHRVPLPDEAKETLPGLALQ